MSMSCWNFTLQKNGPPHHLIIPLTKTLLPPQWLTKVCPGLFSVHGHPKSFLQGKLKYEFAVHCPPFSTFLNLWLIHCGLYIPLFHRRMKYFRLQLPWGKSMCAKMSPWSCWNAAKSQLHFLCKNLFGCSYPQLICTSSQRALRLAPRESNLPAYYGERELHMLESPGPFLSVNSAINIYGGYAYWGKEENRPPQRREQTPAILFLSHCVL